MTSDLIPACLELETQWCRANKCAENQALRTNVAPATAALQHLEQVDVIGGVLYVSGWDCGLYFWGTINQTTFDTCVKKQIRLWEERTPWLIMSLSIIFLRSTSISTRRRLGIGRARKAKLSYQPEVILEKYMAELKWVWKAGQNFDFYNHDSEAFMDLYFVCRYADSLNEYMESDGQVIAALQRIPYRLTYEGMNVPVAYISELVHIRHIGRGEWCEKLLAQAHQSMFREGCCFLLWYLQRIGWKVTMPVRDIPFVFNVEKVINSFLFTCWKLFQIGGNWLKSLQEVLMGMLSVLWPFFSLIVKTAYSIIGKISTSYWRIYFCQEVSCGVL